MSAMHQRNARRGRILSPMAEWSCCRCGAILPLTTELLLVLLAAQGSSRHEGVGQDQAGRQAEPADQIGIQEKRGHVARRCDVIFRPLGVAAAL